MVPVILRALTTTFLCSSSAFAGVCDYRPSQVVGKPAAVAAVGGGVTAASGVAAKAAGVYTLVHATSGATMIGGTWAGASAAGTAGIIGGTGGLIGSTVAVLIAPVTIVAAGAVAASVGAFEGACYFTDEVIDDYAEIDAIVADIARTAPREDFDYIPSLSSGSSSQIRIRNGRTDGPRYDLYKVKDLYIVNGVLKHRDWLANTTIGSVAVISQIGSGAAIQDD